MKEFPDFSYSLFRREAPRVRDILENVVKKNKNSNEYKEFKQIIFHVFQVLNSFMLKEDGYPETRNLEIEENGEKAFVLSHPIKIAQLAFQILPKEFDKNISIKEAAKIENIQSNLRETAITAFFHDFVEDVFEGRFNKAENYIKEILSHPSLSIPNDAKARILCRIKVLTKPPARHASSNIVNKNEKADLYLKEYGEYLDTIIKSNDAISQYIKLIDIFQNAQSQKNTQDKKRTGKARLQADFISKTFPTLIKYFLQKHPDLFKNMSDQNFVKELKNKTKINIQEIIKDSINFPKHACEEL